MLTLFLMLLSPPTSPSPRVEDPHAVEKRILKEEIKSLPSGIYAILMEGKRAGAIEDVLQQRLTALERRVAEADKRLQSLKSLKPSK